MTSKDFKIMINYQDALLVIQYKDVLDPRSTLMHHDYEI